MSLSLETILETENLATLIEDFDDVDVGRSVKDGYETDEQSRAEPFMKVLDHVDRLLKTDLSTKSYPFEKASNINVPALYNACATFAARAYPAMIKDGNIIKMKPVGDDSGLFDTRTNPPTVVRPEGDKQKRADRIGEYMNWQILYKMENWEDDFDDLLHKVAAYGSMFKKVYFDKASGLKRSDLIYPQFLCVNIDAECLEKADRVTEIFYLSPHEIQQRINEKVYIDFDYENLGDGTDNVARPIKFIAQHTRLDLDGDGYPEPYIVVMPDDSEEVIAIYRRFDADDVVYQTDSETRVSYINAKNYFVQYKFMPDPQGGFYGYGYGALILKLNNAANSLINQIIDSGHMSLMGGGFIGKGLRMRGGQMRIPMGMYQVVNASGRDLKDNIVPLDFAPPSGTTLTLFEGILDYIRNTTGMRDVLEGQIRSDQTATATIAQIDNSLNEFKSIFKRLYRSMKVEFEYLYRLNADFPDDEEYKTVLDDEVVIFEDVQPETYDIYPVADASELTNIQRQLKAEAVLALAEKQMVSIKPAIRDYLKAIGVSDIEEYIDFEPTNQDKELQNNLAKAEILEGENKARELEIDESKAEAEILNDVASAIDKLAQARERGENINLRELDILKQFMESNNDDQQGGVPEMVQQPGNQGIIPNTTGQA